MQQVPQEQLRVCWTEVNSAPDGAVKSVLAC